MDYSELIFTCSDSEAWQRDLLINDLANIGFDTFEEIDVGFKAYIASAALDIAAVERLLLNLPDNFSITYTVRPIEPKNWNAVWESNFEPIAVLGRCYVRATFHESKPNYEYEIIIDPKMAFGTGHHQTTSLMMEYLLDSNLQRKRVLDMGCGTGILAILAAKIGAQEITAIDYDPICCTSVKENTELNQVNSIKIYCGSKEVIPNELYDIILANINRNILLDQLGKYAEVIKPHGSLFLSGFYDGDDLAQIVDASHSFGFKYISKKLQDNWVAAKLEKY
ncbi:50S ribosomal protein L11 methyltransferase [Olivibacter sp. SDN3]|uniref:50S ribosomal protein L11 methyltransferase n=1 Tax=Olivibacter sp. SDN3 TaxID=2764720 RepID=UPI00165191BC|nr:50S ribosomal protein L11 methyltransferase [Olivibacter sp. SDN3]QNL48999.1 50S ribosomal protein L11 methyltransferase [Olivibacter sp. SDN3]